MPEATTRSCGTCEHFHEAVETVSRPHILWGQTLVNLASKRETTGCFLNPQIVEKGAGDRCGQWIQRPGD